MVHILAGSLLFLDLVWTAIFPFFLLISLPLKPDPAFRYGCEPFAGVSSRMSRVASAREKAAANASSETTQEHHAAVRSRDTRVINVASSASICSRCARSSSNSDSGGNLVSSLAIERCTFGGNSPMVPTPCTVSVDSTSVQTSCAPSNFCSNTARLALDYFDCVDYFVLQFRPRS